jgi:hypothetical protein
MMERYNNKNAIRQLADGTLIHLCSINRSPEKSGLRKEP